MSSTEYVHTDGDDYLTEKVHTETQTATVETSIPYRFIRLSVEDGRVTANGVDTEMITTEVVDNQQRRANPQTPANRLTAYDGTAIITIDGTVVEVTVQSGVGRTPITVPSGRKYDVNVQPTRLIDQPAEVGSPHTITVVTDG